MATLRVGALGASRKQKLTSWDYWSLLLVFGAAILALSAFLALAAYNEKPSQARAALPVENTSGEPVNNGRPPPRPCQGIEDEAEWQKCMGVGIVPASKNR